MGTGRRAWALGVALATIATAMGLVAAPGLAEPGDAAPLPGVEFVDAWTNDDGRVDGGDLGDNGLDSPAYDAWPLLDPPVSSSDPKAAGIDPAREDKDVAICTAEVGADPGYVEVAVQNAYPAYVCTFVTVVENGTTLPVTVAPAAVTAESGLTVGTLSSLPATLSPGEQAEAVFWVKVEQTAPQGGVLEFSITIELSNTPCTGSVVFGVERTTGDLYEIDLTNLVATRIADIVDPEPGNVNSPNGLAHDPGTGRLYFSAALEGAASSRLYFWDGSAMAYAGTVPGQLTGGDFYAGELYYVSNASDDLLKVTFAANGAVSGWAPVYSDFGGARTFWGGDFVVTFDGTMLYGSSLQNGATPPIFFSVNLGTGAYTTISLTSATNLQLAFGSNGVLYGHSTGAGGFVEVDPATGATTPVGTPVGALDNFTDLASGELCMP